MQETYKLGYLGDPSKLQTNSKNVELMKPVGKVIKILWNSCKIVMECTTC